MIDPEKIWASSQLPTLPSVAVKLVSLAKNPNTEIREVVQLIKSDPAITARILKATNSSYFGIKSQITSIERAVPLLGTTVIASLALNFSLTDAATARGPLVEHYKSYWMQSVVQAVTAELLGSRLNGKAEDEFFMCGLLTDIGRLAILKTIGEEYLPVLTKSQENRCDLYEVEQESFGFDHSLIGEKLLSNWKFPESIITATRLHHASKEELEANADDEEIDLIRAIAVASSAGDYFCRQNRGTALQRLRELAASFYGFSEEKLEELLEQIRERIDQVGELFSADTKRIPDASDLMADANEQLSQLAMREHLSNAQSLAKQHEIEQQKQDLETQNERLKQQTQFDALTQVYNRSFFEEALQIEVAKCCEKAEQLGVLFADIDKFKRINDTYGHQFGDLVLQMVAQAFRKMLRRADVLARYGGEEFVVLVSNPTEKGLEKLAERVRQSVEQTEVAFEGKRVPVTVSIGAAIILPARNETKVGKMLVGEADKAMYRSKENGRNRIHVLSLISPENREILQKVNQNRFSRWLVKRGLFTIQDVTKVLLRQQPVTAPIGELACRHGMLSPADIDLILSHQESSVERFGEIAMRLNLLSNDQLAQLLVFQHEDLLVVGRNLVNQGMIDQTTMASLIKEYFTECLPECSLKQLAPKASARSH